MILEPVRWVLIGCLVLLLARKAQGQVNDAHKYPALSRPGTLKFLVIAGIHSNGKDGCDEKCGKISTTNFPLLVALDWILDIINGDTGLTPYLSNITIGYDVYDNCDDEDRTVDIIYPGFAKVNHVCNRPGTDVSEETYAGILSLTTPEATLAITRLAGPLPILRAQAPVPGLDSLSYPNLIQTVASFEAEAEAMVQFLVKMKWNFIFLIHTDDEYGERTRNNFSAKSRVYEICVHLDKKLKVKYAKTSETKDSAESIIDEVYNHISKGYDKSMTIVYLGYAEGFMHLLEAVKNADKPAGSKISWLFSRAVGADERVTNMNYFKQTSGLALSHRHEVHSDFKEFLMGVLQNKIVSPFAALKSEYLSAIKCESSLPTCHIFKENNTYFLSTFIDSVLVTATMLKELHHKTCSVQGVCNDMKESLADEWWYTNPNSINFRTQLNNSYLPKAYQSQDRILHFTRDGYIEVNADAPLEIYRLPDPSNMIGDFDGSHLGIVEDASSFPTSACNRPQNCPACRLHYDLRYSYLHGDILLLGLFSIHQFGSTPFQCGLTRHDTNDAITVSAFIESILSLRKKTGINYGGVAIDDCYSSLNTSTLLSDLFSKRKILRDHYSDKTIDFDKVFVIVGALSSPVSMIIGDLSTALGVPMISYGASSPELDNVARYPYFLRTVPSDTRQVKGIVQLIQRLNVTYVGALYIDDAYGKNGIKALMEEAKRSGICINQPIAIRQDIDNATLLEVVKNLYIQGTRVIVYFSIDSLALRILQILASSFSDEKPLVFIASEAWGTNQNLIEGQLGLKAKGSLVFNVETMAQNNEDFRQFLLNLNSTHDQHNRWIPRFFEDVHHCDFIDSFDKSRPSNVPPCDPILTLDAAIVDSLYQDQRGLHVMHAVQASINGFSSVVKSVCGTNVVCKTLRYSIHAISLKEAIQGINLGSSHWDLFPFDSSGSGNIGFTIFNIQRNDDDEIAYFKIGSFSKDEKLTLTSAPIFYNDLQRPTTLGEMFPNNIQCTYFRDVCSDVCHVTTTPTTNTTEISTESITDGNKSDSSLLIVGVVLLVFLAVVVLILLVVIVLLLRRQRQQGSDETFSKSEISTINKVPSSNNIYNEVNDYHGSHPISHISATSGHGSISNFSDGPITYADIRQNQMGRHIFDYPDTRSEVLSPMSTKSLSPGMSRPPKKIVEHTRSLSDSKILDAALGQQMMSPKDDYLSSYTRYKGLENLHELSYSSEIPDQNNQVVPSNFRCNSDDSDPDDYIDPDPGSQSQADVKQNNESLTYITANDLINHSDEEESFDDASVGPINDTSFREHNGSAITQKHHEPYNSNLISPSDQEVTAINFPGQDRVTFKQRMQQYKTSESPKRDLGKPTAKDSNDRVRSQPQRTLNITRGSDNHKNQSKSSMSSVPDIIPYDRDDIRAISPDSDEQEVFII